MHVACFYNMAFRGAEFFVVPLYFHSSLTSFPFQLPSPPNPTFFHTSFTSNQGLPVGPPTALVMQMQRVRVFGQHGMILETSSAMENVPAGDCFVVEDRWVVRPLRVGEGGDQGGLSIETSFEVKFVKSTFFRKIIESRSRADTLQYHRRWFEMIEKRSARKHHDRALSRSHAHARRSVHPPRRAGGSGGGGGGKTAGVGGRGGEAVAAKGGRGHAGGAGAREGALSMVSEPVLDLLKRIKWDRFVLAVMVFTCLFYFLRLLLNAMLPIVSHIGLGGRVGVETELLPPSLTPRQLKDLVAELVALRMEVQEMRGELRALAECVSPPGDS